MAPKKSQSSTSTPSKPSSTITTTSSTASSSTSAAPKSSTLPPKSSSPLEIAHHIWTRYLQTTPPRTKLLDAFMAFLALVGAIQFAYCVLAGNYPFNAFLSGFSAAVGQFVLTASLRMQTVEQNLPLQKPPPPPSSTSADKKKGGADLLQEKEKASGGVSSERAFADFVFGSVILHAFCVNFIN